MTQQYTVTTLSGVFPVKTDGVVSAVRLAISRDLNQPNERSIILDPDGYLFPRSAWERFIPTIQEDALDTLRAVLNFQRDRLSTGRVLGYFPTREVVG